MILTAKGWIDDKELLDHESEVTFEEFCKMNSQFLQSGFLEWLIIGNVTAAEALQIADSGCKALKLKEIDLHEITQIWALCIPADKTSTVL